MMIKDGDLTKRTCDSGFATIERNTRYVPSPLLLSHPTPSNSTPRPQTQTETSNHLNETAVKGRSTFDSASLKKSGETCWLVIRKIAYSNKCIPTDSKAFTTHRGYPSLFKHFPGSQSILPSSLFRPKLRPSTYLS